MKCTLYAVFIATVFLSACTSKVDEVTAPAPMSAAEPAGWSRARTWTPTRTPTTTPTPPSINLSGRWLGTFTLGACTDIRVLVTISQTGSSVWGFFPSSCIAGPPNADLEIEGTLQGNTLAVSLWDGDILLATLTGPVSTTAISLWDSSDTIRLLATR